MVINFVEIPEYQLYLSKNIDSNNFFLSALRHVRVAIKTANNDRMINKTVFFVEE